MSARWLWKMLVCSLCLAASGFVCVERVHAQGLYGSIVGAVTDPSSAALPGAQVMATNQETGVSRQVTSNASGAYQILNLQEGTYTVSVTAAGFKPLKKSGVRLTVGQVNQQDVQLQVGDITQEVTVQATAAVLQTETTDVHTTVEAHAIENLPLGIFQNVQSLELLTPGVVSLSGYDEANLPNSLADTPDRSLAMNVNGLPQHANTTRVDGATNVFLWLPDHMVIVPPAATLQEVNIQTATYGVQKGLTAGKASDMTTKSGTNQIHGMLYGSHNDQVFNAQNTLAPLARKPKLIRNSEGVSIGGPIKKKKLFYFANWDGSFRRQIVTNRALIPPTNMRQGDFSSYLGNPLFDSAGNPIQICTSEGGLTQLRQNMIFDPASGNTATGQNRCVFSSEQKINVIPANRMYRGAVNYWKLLPAPNQGETYTTSLSANDISTRNSAWNRNIYTGKVDYNISDRQLLWLKYTIQKSLLNEGATWGLAGQGGGTGRTDSTAQTVTIGHNWTALQNMVVTGHIGFTRMGQNNQLPDFNQPLGQSVLKLANSNFPLDDNRYTGMPAINLPGFAQLGTYLGWEPFWRNDWTLTLDESATWVHGKHQVSYGFNAAHNHMNHWQPESTCCSRGSIFTSTYGTFLNLAPASNPIGSQQTVYTNTNGTIRSSSFNPSNWNGIAMFDLGLTSEAAKAMSFIKATPKDWQHALYVGDIWRATPRLTVNLAVRWEYFPLITRDGASKFEMYDPTTNILSFGGVGGNPTHLGATSSKTLFAPRIGLAYRLDNNTVIRAGFGIANDTVPLERSLRAFYPLSIYVDHTLTGNTNLTRYLPLGTFDTNNPNAFPGLEVGVPVIPTPTGFYTGHVTPPKDVTLGSLAPGAFHRPYVPSWNFTVERKLPSQVLLSVGYVGNHLVHELHAYELDAAPLGEGNAGNPLFSKFGRTGRTVQFQGYLDSHYNSLQVSLRRSVASGLFLQGAYTYSKAIGYIDDETASWNTLRFNCPPSALMPQGCLALNRHTLAFDHTQVLKMAFTYNLPFGTGRRFANSNRIARYIAGGWQMNGVFSAMSGAPLTPSQTTTYINAPQTAQDPDYIGPLNITKKAGPGQTWFNPTAFQPVTTARIGNAGPGLSWLRGPGIVQLDASLFRHFKMKEKYDIEARIEAQNATNSPHFNNPNMTCSIVTLSTGQNGCGGTMGQITSSFGARIVQVAMKVRF